MRHFVHYIPIATTVLAVVFSAVIIPHAKRKGWPAYLTWWALGVVAYGVGTLTESVTTLFGWDEQVFRAWYVSGALLGGAPLAQGTVYLLLKKRTADVLSVALGVVVAIAAVFVYLAPVTAPPPETYRLTGAVMDWQWVRAFSPFVNIYAFVFLVGGAVWSAWQYRGAPEARSRYVGNILIAVGALLPGIGGSFTRFGYVEVLYVTELVGLSLIFWGYLVMRADRSGSVHRAQQEAAQVAARSETGEAAAVPSRKQTPVLS